MAGVDVTLILHKRAQFDKYEGGQITANLHMFECENPYALIFMLANEKGEQCRLDITKDEIANQLHKWLEGDLIDGACVTVSSSVEEEIMRYVKFGSPPKPLL